MNKSVYSIITAAFLLSSTPAMAKPSGKVSKGTTGFTVQADQSEREVWRCSYTVQVTYPDGSTKNHPGSGDVSGGGSNMAVSTVNLNTPISGASLTSFDCTYLRPWG